jgi:Ca-activated chloride channel family protein
MQVNLRNLCFALIAVAVVFTSGYAQQQEDKADKTLAPYFVVKGDPSVDQLPLKDTHVDISVSGVIADVKVRQIYRNEGSRPINASYVFPASTRAAVYSMRMQNRRSKSLSRPKRKGRAHHCSSSNGRTCSR